MHSVAKEPLRKRISVRSQSSVELDATKLLELMTADDNKSVDDTDVRITRKSLSKIKKDLNLTEEELDIIFKALDSDEDGIITASELREKSHSENFMVFEKCPDEVEVLPELSEDLTLLDADWSVFRKCLFFSRFTWNWSDVQTRHL